MEPSAERKYLELVSAVKYSVIWFLFLGADTKNIFIDLTCL